MGEDRRAAASAVLSTHLGGEGWTAALDPDAPEWLRSWLTDLLAAARAGDVDWLLGHSHPEIEISQPREIPGATIYRGPEAMIDALLDWPRQWENFQLEPRRIFSPDGERAIILAIHRGRSRAVGVEVEAEIAWLFAWDDELMRRWDMFMGLDAAMRDGVSPAARG